MRGVERAPALLDHAAVGHLVGEGVLERVLEVGKEARLVQELRRLQLREGAPQLVLCHLRDRLQERHRHVLADDRGGLEQPLQLGARAGRCARPRIACTVRRHLDGLDRPAPAGRRRARRPAPASRRAFARSPRGRADCPPSARSGAAVSDRDRRRRRPGACSAARRRSRAAADRCGAGGSSVLLPHPCRYSGTIVDAQASIGAVGRLSTRLSSTRLGLGVDPVEVLEHEQQRLDADSRAAAARLTPSSARWRRCAGIEGEERIVSPEGVEHPQDSGHRVLERRGRGSAAVPVTLARHAAGIVAIVDAKVAAQEIGERQERRCLAIGDRAGLRARASDCVRCEWMNSKKSRDLPTPGSPTTATTCPRPRPACSAAWRSCVHLGCRGRRIA